MDGVARTEPGAQELLALARRDPKAAERALAGLPLDAQVAIVCESPLADRGRILGLVPNPEALIPELPPAEFCFTVKAIGLADAAWVIEYATPEQTVAALDLDAWRGNDVDIATANEWLQAFARTSSEAQVRTLESIDSELLVLALRARIGVEQKPDDWQGWSPPADSLTLEGQFHYWALADGDDIADVTGLLRSLFESAYWSYFRLMQAIMWELESDSEEWALRWRTGRLEDLGFPTWDDAMRVYRFLDERARRELPAEETLVPAEWPLPDLATPAARDRRRGRSDLPRDRRARRGGAPRDLLRVDRAREPDRRGRPPAARRRRVDAGRDREGRALRERGARPSRRGARPARSGGAAARGRRTPVPGRRQPRSRRRTRLSARRRLERRWLGLPPARSAVLESNAWMTAADGVRLATRVLRPSDASVRRGTVLIRTERPLAGGNAGSPIERLAHWLAEDGRTVAIQTCRGRDASEGEFRPFADEVADGDAALRWISEQPWCDGSVVLLGVGYSAFAAWAALSAASAPVAGLVAGFGARDPYAWLHPGGVLQLEAALALAARVDGRFGYEPSALDLDRAARHRPLGECDRVALRELSAFRDWLAHPKRDAWWRDRTPALPASPPRALFLGGWYECAFPAVYADFETISAHNAERGLAAPELLIGPWGAAPIPREERARGTNLIAVTSRAVLRFVAHAVGARPVRDVPARVFVRGAGWREALRWPPESTREHTLYLRGDGSANSAAGDGRLAAEPGQDRADSFVSDPADPVPSLGGAAVAGVAGAVDQRPVEERGDVLCFTGEPLSASLEIAGRVRLCLHADAPASAQDTSAKLVAVAPNGAARWLAEGIARAHPDAGPFEIDLGVAAARIAAGTRLRVEVAGSSLPRFARCEPGDPAPLVRTVYHDHERPSALRFYAVP